MKSSSFIQNNLLKLIKLKNLIKLVTFSQEVQRVVVNLMWILVEISTETQNVLFIRVYGFYGAELSDFMKKIIN